MSAAPAATTAIVARFRALRLVPVLVIDEPDDAAPLAAALAEGGLPLAEVTFRTASASECIARIAGEHPDVVLGAGTVLAPADAQRAVDVGARFIVSPGFAPAVVDWCLGHGVPVFPGVCTPTEVEMARAKGLSTLKFFPAQAAGGTEYLKAIAGPYADVQFVPTGGVNAGNVASYLALKNVVACGGSWMAPREWIREGRFDRIREETREAVAAVAAADAGGAR